MSHLSHPAHDDEIDLIELAKNLWQQKWMIISITFAATLIAAVAAFSIQPTYKNEAIISETSAGELAPINRFKAEEPPSYTISGVRLVDDNLTPSQSFNLFYKALTSADTLEAAFSNSHYAKKLSELDTISPQTTDQLYQKFRNNLNISLKKADVPRIIITMTSHDSELATNIINNHLIPLASQKVIFDEEQAISAELNREKFALMNEIQIIEHRYHNANLHRQNQLKQAIAMAQAGNITKPQLGNLPGTNSEQYLFLLGTDTLEAELTQTRTALTQYRSITNTDQKQGSGPLIPGVAEKFYRYQQLDNFKPDFSNTAPVKIEQYATPAFTPVKPQKKLIIVAGLVLGGMLAVFAALIRITIQNRQSRIQVATLSAETSQAQPKTPA